MRAWLTSRFRVRIRRSALLFVRGEQGRVRTLRRSSGRDAWATRLFRKQTPLPVFTRWMVTP